MIAQAYRFGEQGGPLPDYLGLAGRLERWGVWEVLGRPLYYREIARMEKQEAVVMALRRMHEYESWADWADEHPGDPGLVEEAKASLA